MQKEKDRPETLTINHEENDVIQEVLDEDEELGDDTMIGGTTWKLLKESFLIPIQPNFTIFTSDFFDQLKVRLNQFLLTLIEIRTTLLNKTKSV